MAKSDKITSAITKAVEEKLSGRTQSLPSDPDAEKTYPHLWAWLTFQELEDGTIKVPAEIRIKLDHGDWSVSLQDVATGRAMRVMARSIAECLPRLEAALGSPDAKWSVWDDSRGKLIRKKPEKDT